MLIKKFSLLNTSLPTFLFLSLLLLITSIATAQSGRRLPKLSPKPEATTPAKETSKEEDKPAKPQDKEPQIRVMVAYQLSAIFGSHILTNAVMEGCVTRLQKSMGLTAQFGKEMNRKEAIDIAKTSPDIYVLWLQLESESFGPDVGKSNVQSYYVNFVLFSPITGKSKSSGHVYQRQSVMGSIPQGNSSAEYTLRRAGRDVADKILSALNLPLPPDRY